MPTKRNDPAVTGLDLAPTPVPAAARPGSNLPEYGVSALAQAVKRTVEEAFGYVRVRGEVSQPKRHVSGHLYLRLKDDAAVLDAVCWRGTASKLALQPTDGMEVICTGRLTTYPGRSSYQLIIEAIELAGEGALLKLLEERKARLAAEGLFETARKRKLPFLPDVIGVITSPTGAVIRDILHRLNDRFPRRVLVWPVAVQGATSAGQVVAAIEGFNRLAPGGAVPRPDVLIVARGGGSLEDLMPFNEEAVVRAVAASVLPVVAAVGHETDVTLIDLAADLRAPTPTAAAELTVPVRGELIVQTLDRARRLAGGFERLLAERRVRVEGLARGLGDPIGLIETARQRLDDRAERLGLAVTAGVRDRRARVERLGTALRHPREQIADARARLGSEVRALGAALRQAVTAAADRHRASAARLTPAPLVRRLTDQGERLGGLADRLARAGRDAVEDGGRRLAGAAQLLDSLSYRNVLRRGYAVVRGADGRALTGAAEGEDGAAVAIAFHDGSRAATLGASAPDRAAAADDPAAPSAPAAPARRRRRAAGPAAGQGDLF